MAIAGTIVADLARGDKLINGAKLFTYAGLAYVLVLGAGYIYMQHAMEQYVSQQEAAVLT